MHEKTSLYSTPMEQWGPVLSEIARFNDTAADYPSHKTIIDLIEEQAELHPEREAIIFNGLSLSYREMNERANKLARRLQETADIRPDDRIGLMIDRSERLIISLLAILKTGAAYVPMPPLYPLHRLQDIADGSRLSLIVSEKALESMAAQINGAPAVYWEDVPWDKLSVLRPDRSSTAGNLMYIMFTSGSTGGPKGVAIEHKSVVNALTYFIRHVIPAAAQRMLSVSTYAFDISVLEMFPPLMTGNAVVVASQQDQLNPDAIMELIIRSEIAVVQSTPSTWAMLVDTKRWAEVKPLTIICGGEYLSPALGMTLLKGHHQVWNVYGPTETTIWSTTKAVKQESDLLTIGSPVANTEIYILDNLQPQPVGEAGEICISGDGLSRGYFGQETLTSARFIAHPFRQGHRLYRTGDLGRWLSNGEIEYLGRKDDQVKIRGYRIELQEIEGAIAQLEGVEKVVVRVKEDSDYDKKLIAFLACNEAVAGVERGDLVRTFRQQLKKLLPVYMVPHDFVLVKKMPLNDNGKIDRIALMEQYVSAPGEPLTATAFADEYEQTIAQAWMDVLQFPHFGMTDNFFELGGHSLLLTKLYNRLPAEYREKIALQDLFLHNTVAAQAALLRHRLLEGNTYDNDSRSDIISRQLLDDARIVPEVTITGAVSAATMNAPENVLLTGANGYVGVHVLIELLQQTTATIYCLVRAENEDMAAKRLKQAFEQFLLPPHWLSDERVKPVTGDLNEPLLGLSPAQFQALARKTDVVYHCGSSVNFIEPYSIIRKANILGLQEIIKFAATGKVKPISLFSTIAVFSWGQAFTNKRWMTEEDDLFQNLPAVSRDLTYVQSKWVMEQMAALAAERGVPVITFRLGYALCNSRTGATAVYQWWSTLVKSCIANQAYPWLLGHKTQLTTVDYMAKCIVHISRKKDAIGRKFHLTPLPEGDVSILDFFDRINQYFGFNMEALPYEEWLNRWKDRETDPLFPLLGMFSDKVYRGLTLKQAYQDTYYFGIDNTLEFMKDSDTKYPPMINKTVLQSYLRFLGVLGKADFGPEKAAIAALEYGG